MSSSSSFYRPDGQLPTPRRRGRRRGVPGVGIAAALAVVAACAADAARAQQAFFMGLGDLPGGEFFSSAQDVSADGSVAVGVSGGQAFRWTRETGMVALEGTTGAGGMRVSGDGATVIGRLGSPADSSFRWTQPTGTVVLPAGITFARNVNGDGSVIVGQRESPFEILEAVQWKEGVGVTKLFADRSPPTRAWDIFR